jgi:hypothetical protein
MAWPDDRGVCMPMPDDVTPMHTCSGGCHCGAVRFSVELPQRIEAHRCNCSICSQTGFIHVIVTADRFHLLQGEDGLTEYRFHTRTARHLFCSRCGVKSFYVPRSHPDGYSINLNCLNLTDAFEVEVTDFDGRHWSRSVGRLHADTDAED